MSSAVGNAVGTAKDQVIGLVGKLVESAPRGRGRQTVTVNCSISDAEEFWRDPQRVSVVLGELGDVEFTAPDRYRWRLHAGSTGLSWDSRLSAEPGGLHFADDAGSEIAIGYRAAPHGLGTEMTLSATLPAPGLLAGTAAFAILYRTRALIQTGEVPTIAKNPSARASAR